MKTYRDDRILSLSDYKATHLTTDPGTWRDKEYAHILPYKQKEKNILEDFRDDFWNYFRGTAIKLHPDFQHLNSSQALCFNLFFPIFHIDKRFLTYVLHRIIEVMPVQQISREKIDKLYASMDENYAGHLDEEFIILNEYISCEFEKIVDRKEFTNFDFFVQLQGGQRVLFELKYTENGFARAKLNKGHSIKYQTVYQPRLANILKQDYNNEDFALKHYQLIRNLSYLDEFTTVVFIFPEANEHCREIKNLLYDIMLPNFSGHVKVIYLEDLVREILTSDYLAKLRPEFERFKEKYLD